jgi:hypothetical protein
MKKSDRKIDRRWKPAARSPWLKAGKWLAAAGVVAVIVYGVTQMSGVAYDERALGVVNFSELTSGQKRTALQAANAARCSCGCGLGLAQCVATDSTCPIRDSNIERIKGMVRDASGH